MTDPAPEIPLHMLHIDEPADLPTQLLKDWLTAPQRKAVAKAWPAWGEGVRRQFIDLAQHTRPDDFPGAVEAFVKANAA